MPIIGDKESVEEYLLETIERAQDNLKKLRFFKKGRTYKIIFRGLINIDGVCREKEELVLFGKPIEFYSDSITFKILASDYDTNLCRVGFRSMVHYEEWQNAKTPHLEAPFLVNLRYVSPQMKKKCFKS